MKLDLNALVPGATHFYWREMLWLPSWQVHVFPDVDQFNNLIAITEKLEHIRALFNKPVIVTSGLRPGLYNKAIGGAPYSAHREGKAIDFKIAGLFPDWVRSQLQPLLSGMKIRMEDLPGSGWCHIDLNEPNPNRYFKP